jgi:hypothetical protein
LAEQRETPREPFRFAFQKSGGWLDPKEAEISLYRCSDNASEAAETKKHQISQNYRQTIARRF